MKFRARTNNGNFTVGEDLTRDSNNINDLYQDIKVKLGLQGDVSVKYGFPPKPLVGDLSTLLSQTGLKDGDILIVDAVAAAAAPPHSSIPSAASQPVNDLQTGFGTVVAREMKDDNSCLFRTIAFLFLRNAEECSSLRSIVAAEILKDPFNYNEAILGRPVTEYCSWIQKQNSWGGAIELNIFAKYFQTEIVSIDIASGRLDVFGEGVSPSSSVAFAIYSGIHYDAIAVSPTNSKVPDDFDMVVFTRDEAPIVQEKVQQLGREWKAQRKFTDLGSFTLKCGVCSVGLKGQKEAQSHAMSTGHQSFTEY